MSALVNVTKPAGYPVTLSEAKAHCRITNTTHDDRITSYIAAATVAVESVAEMRLVEQTVRLELDGFPTKTIEVPVYPVRSIVSLKYDDADNVEQTLVEGTDFYARVGGRYPEIAPVDEWPDTCENKPGSVRVVLAVGFATDSSPLDYTENIPEDLRHAVLVKVKEFFDYGGETIVSQNQVSPSANTVDLLTRPYKRWYAV